MQDVILEGNRIIVRSYGGAEYAGAPKSWPAVVLEGKEDKYNSSVEIIYSGPYHAAKFVAETGCPSAGYLAVVIQELLEINQKDKTEPPIGNIIDHLGKTIVSFMNDGLASLAEHLECRAGTGGFSEAEAKALQRLCKKFVTTAIPDPNFQEAVKVLAGDQLNRLYKDTRAIACAKIGK
jgi:hypothetical protein